MRGKTIFILLLTHMGVGLFPGVDFFPVARRGGTIFGSRGGVEIPVLGGGQGWIFSHVFCTECPKIGTFFGKKTLFV